MKHRLLIADHDADLCEIFRMFFTKVGYEVETSTDGLDCLTKLRELSPAVLVLDLGLLWGGADGVLAWLREQRPAPRIAVLLTSTASELPDIAEFNEPPVVDYLPKPFRLTDLLDRVRSAVARKEQRAPLTLNCVASYSENFIG